MTTFVTGATSQLGHFLLPLLAARGQPVLALSRRARRAGAPGVEWAAGTLEHFALPARHVDAVVSFGPLPALAAWIERTAGLDGARLVAVSSMSAETKANSPVAAERAVSRLLCDAERALIDVCTRRRIAWTVLRPTLIYGAGLDRSFTPLVRRARRWHVFPLPGGTGLRQPVHAQDVALAALAALDRPAFATLPIGGGERLSVRETFERVRDSAGTWSVPLHLPQLLVHGAARVPSRLQGALARLDQDLVADNAPLFEHLRVQPRLFQPDARCWQAGAA